MSGSQEAIMSSGVPQQRASHCRMFQQRFSGAEKRASALGGQGQSFPEGFLLELCGSWFNWRCQLKNQAKAENLFEELFSLSLCVTPLALFCPTLSQKERNGANKILKVGLPPLHQ